MRFHLHHRPLGQANAALIGVRHQADHRVFALPGHGLGKLDHGLHRVSHIPIPVLLHDPPPPFDRIVFAVIRGVIGQADRELRGLGEGHEPVEKLGAMAVILWPVIQVDHQGLDLLKAVSHAVPPLLQHIDRTITGDFGGDTSHKQFIRLGHQDAHRSQGGPRFAHRDRPL